MELDTAHAEMFPYAIALARQEGASRIYVGEPRLLARGGGRLVPDVLGVKPGGGLVVVECEKAHGNIFDEGGKISRWSRSLAEDDQLRKACSFHFILRGKAWYRRKQIRRFLGDGPKIYRFEDLTEDVEPVRF